MQCTIQRAAHRIDSMHALHRFAGLFWRNQPHGHVNAAYYEDTFLRFHLASHIRNELAVARVDVARLQRASKSPGHSTGGSGNDIIDRGGMSFGKFGGIDLVVLGNRTVDAKGHRMRFTRQLSDAQRASLSFDANFGNVDYIGHGRLQSRSEQSKHELQTGFLLDSYPTSQNTPDQLSIQCSNHRKRVISAYSNR